MLHYFFGIVLIFFLIAINLTFLPVSAILRHLRNWVSYLHIFMTCGFSPGDTSLYLLLPTHVLVLFVCCHSPPLPFILPLTILPPVLVSSLLLPTILTACLAMLCRSPSSFVVNFSSFIFFFFLFTTYQTLPQVLPAPSTTSLPASPRSPPAP